VAAADRIGLSSLYLASNQGHGGRHGGGGAGLGGASLSLSADIHLNVLNTSHDRTAVCIFEHVQWRWALNNRLALG
jgi:hypothetical protein